MPEGNREQPLGDVSGLGRLAPVLSAAQVIPRHDEGAAKQVQTGHRNMHSDSGWLHAGTDFILPSVWARLEASRSAQRARAHAHIAWKVARS